MARQEKSRKRLEKIAKLQVGLSEAGQLKNTEPHEEAGAQTKGNRGKC